MIGEKRIEELEKKLAYEKKVNECLEYELVRALQIKREAEGVGRLQLTGEEKIKMVRQFDAFDRIVRENYQLKELLSNAQDTIMVLSKKVHARKTR